MIKVNTDRTVYAGITDTAARAHAVRLLDGARIPAQYAALAVPGTDAYDAARARVLHCFGCNGKHTAVELYRESDLPGECEGCAEAFFGCDLPGCDGMHHPEDPCDS